MRSAGLGIRAGGENAGAAAAITTGTNWGVSSATLGDGSLPATRRKSLGVHGSALLLLEQQPGLAAPCEHSCCGDSPVRRAPSDTLAPDSKLSTKMRAFSAFDRRRTPWNAFDRSERGVRRLLKMRGCTS
jgi:hypothetical protein